MIVIVLPELTFRDEDVFALDTHKNVGLAFIVERLASRSALKAAVQLDKKLLSDIRSRSSGERIGKASRA